MKTPQNEPPSGLPLAPAPISPEVGRDVLIAMASDMLTTGEMPPDDSSDWGFSKSTTLRDKVRVIGYARRSREQCRRWAIRLRALADSLPNVIGETHAPSAEVVEIPVVGGVDTRGSRAKQGHGSNKKG